MASLRTCRHFSRCVPWLQHKRCPQYDRTTGLLEKHVRKQPRSPNRLAIIPNKTYLSLLGSAATAQFAFEFLKSRSCDDDQQQWTTRPDGFARPAEGMPHPVQRSKR